MIAKAARWLAALLLVGAASVEPTWGQTQAPTPEKKEEAKKPPTLWEEIKLFSYVENSYTFNLTGSGRDATNEGRFYDFDEGYTFNVAEFSVKKDPSERYPFGFGLVGTAGIDSQKNHSLGLFRGRNDVFPFRNTSKFDVQEVYVAGTVPLGSGLTLKAGKWVTLLGYEVIESPNNPNFSRGYLFTLAIPLTHTGAIASYAFADWVTVQFGAVNGWDNTDDNNGARSFTGQFAFTPLKDLTANLNWIAGPEQNGNNDNDRYVLDFVFNYTGLKGLTLGLNIDYGHEDREAFIASLGTRQDTGASWWGWAAYAAYDWTEQLRTALRQEYFKDADGARTGFGSKLSLWSTTATVQYKIWKGLVGRLEYRHDNADEKAYKIRVPGLVPTSKSLDTISLSLYYQFL